MKTTRSRREFLRLSAAGTVGAMVLGHYSCKTKGTVATETEAADPRTFGVVLQLYTISDAMGTDVQGSLK